MNGFFRKILPVEMLKIMGLSLFFLFLPCANNLWPVESQAYPPVNSQLDITRGVHLSRNILGEGGPLAKLVAERDEEAFDVFMHLLREGKRSASGEIVISDIRRNEFTRKHPKQKKGSPQDIEVILKRLENQYGLIISRMEEKGHMRIVLPGGGSQSGDSVTLSARYWDYQWYNVLNLSPKILWIYAQAELGEGVFEGDFVSSLRDFSQKSGLEISFISKGIWKLRIHNLIDIKYLNDHSDRKDTREVEYSLHEFYDPESLKEGIEKLKVKYDPRKVRVAIFSARVVYEDNNIDGITRLLELEAEHGLEALQRAVLILSKKSKDDPERSIENLFHLIENP